MQCLGVTPSVLYSGITTSRLKEQYEMPGIVSGSATCKANMLPTVLLLWLPKTFVIYIYNVNIERLV